MNVRKQMIRESEEEDSEIWSRWEQEYYEAQRNYRGMFWAFEFKNIEIDEWEYDDIKYNRNTHTLNWNEYSIDVDPTLSVDDNLNALMDEIMNSGKYE
jgi:hypothetical protein